jgi:hypothetical protein
VRKEAHKWSTSSQNSLTWIEQETLVNLNGHTQEEAMSKEHLLQELADAYEKLMGTATEAAQRGVTRQGDTWGPREIVAHLAGWEVMATVRIPHIVAGMPPLEEADETRRVVMNDAINATIVTVNVKGIVALPTGCATRCKQASDKVREGITKGDRDACPS